MKLSWLPWRRTASLREAEGRLPFSLGSREALEVDQLVEATDLVSFLAFERDLGETIAERRRFEADLVPQSAQAFTLPGHCIACGDRREFAVGFEYATGILPDGRTLPNWREHLICRGCGLNNRMRAALHVLETHIDPGRD